MTLLLWLCLLIEQQHWDDRVWPDYGPAIDLEEAAELVKVFGVVEKPYYSKCVKVSF